MFAEGRKTAIRVAQNAVSTTTSRPVRRRMTPSEEARARGDLEQTAESDMFRLLTGPRPATWTPGLLQSPPWGPHMAPHLPLRWVSPTGLPEAGACDIVLEHRVAWHSANTSVFSHFRAENVRRADVCRKCHDRRRVCTSSGTRDILHKRRMEIQCTNTSVFSHFRAENVRRADACRKLHDHDRRRRKRRVQTFPWISHV